MSNERYFIEGNEVERVKVESRKAPCRKCEAIFTLSCERLPCCIVVRDDLEVDQYIWRRVNPSVTI